MLLIDRVCCNKVNFLLFCSFSSFMYKEKLVSVCCSRYKERFASKQQPVYLCFFVSPQDVKSESAMGFEGYQNLMKVVVDRRIPGREVLSSLPVIYEKLLVTFAYL